MLPGETACGRGLSGKELRLGRLFSSPSGRALIVPIDHSVTLGPLGRHDHADRTAATLATAGADAIVVHKGRARTIAAHRFGRLGLVVHLSAGTSMALDDTSKVLVSSVEEALCLGADAVSVHVNVGSPSEPQQLADLGATAHACDRLGMPLLAMMYARGPAIAESRSVRTLAHLAAIATDLGADVVKVDYSGDPAAMAEVVGSCPLPVLAAGGPTAPDDDAAIAFGIEVSRSGVAGLSFGRQIFGAHEPERVARALADHLHGLTTPPRNDTPALEFA
ncbi:2-amino-3,7-dideoxy-D-threo-hept-6-ulosonate synthase [Gordonia sp. ABSL1-1]|uniref:2-amino-3,7-dideoxy-D-threo-hept-6-ulosonate synthase n=1 Tax=Gordonia sp. ABSL1-1 TaxID=3053923 RepID=UPI0025736943|nr:2-amino-3,7-dideoxy-D-threo-hept-6-ulosonate synthase [Gordonia sp. ABSL1-1]MDL9936513.1 2-amino-3,7-dideoxy-D-threo-hept-6-ulosonate synthase [Gordonia sp. ABSL1-1]